MPTIVEMGQSVTLANQLKSPDEPVVLINVFVVPAEESEALIAAWTKDAGHMKAQSGFISTQLHRGIAGSGVFLNYAVWQSVGHFRTAFSSPGFQASLADYPEKTSISPHLFTKVTVPGICVA